MLSNQRISASVGGCLLRPVLGSLLQRFYCGVAATMAATVPTWRPNFVSVERGGGPGEEACEEPSTSIRIVSYNILAQAYVKSATFPHSPSACLKWKARSRAVLSRLLSFDADFLCLQELDEFESFYRQPMSKQGYDSVYLKRGGRKRDGCGIFFRRSRFELLDRQEIDYNRLVPDSSGQDSSGSEEEELSMEKLANPNDPRVRLKRDCVGIMAAFRFVDGPQHVLLIANTHLYWDPAWADVKLAQAKYLLSCLAEYQQTLSERFKAAPLVLVTGDFNSQPGDEVYLFLVNANSSRDKGSVQISSRDQTGDVTVPRDSEPSPVQLRSLYAQARGEPPFTNVSPGFTGTLDYILFHPSELLKPKCFLELPDSESASELAGGLPNHSHPSDHLPLGADFVIRH